MSTLRLFQTQFKERWGWGAEGGGGGGEVAGQKTVEKTFQNLSEMSSPVVCSSES